MTFEIVSLTDEGLGHSGHIVAINGRALVIDPLRHVDAYVDLIEQRGWRLAWTADTHTHADYASGGPELARRGAVFLASRRANLQVPHRALDGGEEVRLGELTLRALPTPGHTPDHLAYLLLDDRRPVAVFTGGSLMVGTVGRTDLAGPEHADRLAREMWRGLHEQLLTLPDNVPIYPTHGAGSFCSAPGTNERISTIGQQRANNPLLQSSGEDEFVALLLSSLGPLPAYFSWLPEKNRLGFGPAPAPLLERLSVGDVQHLLSEGAEVVDVRAVAEFAHAHIPGALSNLLRPAFASWLGAAVAPDRPLVFVAESSTDRAELLRQCANIGYDRIAGELTGGVDAWIAEGLPTNSIELIPAQSLHRAVIDVRSDAEFRAGHVPGAQRSELTELSYPSAPFSFAEPVTVMCGHGERAATAASLLARQGNTEVSIVIGGPADWAEATKQPLEVGG